MNDLLCLRSDCDHLGARLVRTCCFISVCEQSVSSETLRQLVVELDSLLELELYIVNWGLNVSIGIVTSNVKL